MRYLVFIFFMFTMSVSAQDEVSPFAPVQLRQGEICEIITGVHFRELLYDGADVTVESFMGEEVQILKYNFNIMECATVSAVTDDEGMIFGISTKDTTITTPEGAHVGMTVSELKEIYPDAKIYLPEVPYGLTEFSYYFSIDGLGRFVIHASSILEKCDYQWNKCVDYISDLKSVRFETY